MKLPRRQFLHLAAGAAALPALPRIARAQTYPSRPVRVIVPFAPGGPTDIFARLVAQKLSERFGKQFYVENIGGAGGNVGMGQGAKAAPDGYTMLVVATTIVVNPTLYERVPFDPYKDFDPVTLAVTSPEVLSVNPSLPVQSVKDLVAFIKAHPGKYTFASPGTGTPGHLVGELFRLSLGLDLVHIPFNSAGLAIGSTLAGHTPIAFTTPPPVVPQVKEGKLRALAVSASNPLPLLPGVPPISEASGAADFETVSWHVLLAPAKTPRPVVDRLHAEMKKIFADPDIVAKAANIGLIPTESPSIEGISAYMKSEQDKWGSLVKTLGLQGSQ